MLTYTGAWVMGLVVFPGSIAVGLAAGLFGGWLRKRRVDRRRARWMR